MIDRLSEPDPPRTIEGEIIDILSVSGRPVTANGLIGRMRIGTRREIILALASLMDRGEVKMIEIGGRKDCLVLANSSHVTGRKMPTKTAKARAHERILALLADAPKTRSEVAAHIGSTKTAVTNFVRELEIIGKVERLPPVKLPGSNQSQVLIRLKEKSDE